MAIIVLGRGAPYEFSGCSVTVIWNLFFYHISNDCGRGESFGTTTCLKAVVDVSKGMFPVKYFRSNKAFLCLLNFMEIISL